MLASAFGVLVVDVLVAACCGSDRRDKDRCWWWTCVSGCLPLCRWLARVGAGVGELLFVPGGSLGGLAVLGW